MWDHSPRARARVLFMRVGREVPFFPGTRGPTRFVFRLDFYKKNFQGFGVFLKKNSPPCEESKEEKKNSRSALNKKRARAQKEDARQKKKKKIRREREKRIGEVVVLSLIFF